MISGYTIACYHNNNKIYKAGGACEMVTMVKILVAIIKIQIFIFKFFANYEQIAELEAKLEELQKQQQEQE